MYRVLIVEDEMLVRIGLKNTINWEKYDMTIVADTSNGQEAWEVFEREKPELVITDLKMPVMDGMELIKKIREKNTRTKIIILSCLEEFEVVRKAMSLGVTEYIPKLTMKRADIEAVIAKVYEEFKVQGVENINNSAELVRTNDLKDKFLKDCLFTNKCPSNIFGNSYSSLNLKLQPKQMAVCLVEINHYSSIRTKFNDERGRWFNTIIMDTIVKVVEDSKRGEVLKDNDKRYIIVLSYFDMQNEKIVYEQINILIGKVRKILKNYIDIEISIGVSSLKNDYYNLGSCYSEAQKALLFKLYQGLDKTFFWDEGNDRKYKAEAKSIIKDLENSLSNNIYLSNNQRENCRLVLETLYEKGFETIDDIYRTFYQLMYWNSVELSYSYARVSNLLQTYQEEIEEHETFEELLCIYKLYIEKLKDINDKKYLISKEVAEAMKYMQSNAESNLSLQQVSDYVSLSPNYLSSLFKKELEQTFTEYMINIKIQKAKNLLLDSNLKLYEIASKTGFTDEAYFSKIFKRCTGKSPYSFRKRYLADSIEELENENT